MNGIHRVTPDSKRGRQMNSFRRQIGTSKYMPHIGAKEQERAKRLHESFFLNEPVAVIEPRVGHLRSTPTLCQMSKKQHERSTQV